MRWHGIGIGAELKDSGERGLFDYLKRQLHRPLCILDAGANRGQFLGMAGIELRGIPCDIHCFEPSQSAFEYLSAVGQEYRSNTMRIHLHPNGVGAEAGEFTLYAPEPGSGMGSLIPRQSSQHSQTFGFSESVTLIRLSQFITDLLQNGASQIDLLKLDVEGLELQVLEDIKPLLTAPYPVKAISFEFGPANLDSQTRFFDFYQLFTQAGYQLFRLTPTGYFYQLPLYTEFMEQYRVSNYIALAPLG
jgi:FkbM family methyltransferase